MSNTVSIFRSNPSYRIHPPTQTLVNALHAVEETTAYNGAPRHRAEHFNRLVSLIAGKSFAPPLYMCCHFLQLSASSGHLLHEWLLSPSTINARHLESLLDIPSNLGFVERNGQLFTWLNSETRSVSFRSNIAELVKSVSLLDFIVESLGYDILADAYDELAIAQSSHEIGLISNKLARLLYDYLSQHLPTAHSQTKYLSFVNFIMQKNEDPYAPESITDDLILEFWSASALDDKTKMRLYSICAQSWARYQQAVRLSSCNIFSAISNDSDNFDILSNVSIEDVDQYIEGVEEQNNLEAVISSLRQTALDKVKFLTGRELDSLEPLMVAQDQSPLLVTALRVARFAPIQAKLVEGLRKNKSLETMQAILDETHQGNTYQDELDKWLDIALRCKGVGEATCYWLFHDQQPHALAALQTILTSSERDLFDTCLNQARQEISEQTKGPKDIEEMQAGISAHFMLNFKIKGDVILSRLKKSAQNFRRTGLKPSEIDAEGKTVWANILLQGTGSLSLIFDFIHSYLDRFSVNANTQPLLNQSKDSETFSFIFHKLYLEARS